MTTRIVKSADNDSKGTIVSVMLDTGERVSKENVISDINGKMYLYFAQARSGEKAQIHVFKDKYLKTEKDNTEKDNLDFLSKP